MIYKSVFLMLMSPLFLLLGCVDEEPKEKKKRKSLQDSLYEAEVENERQIQLEKSKKNTSTKLVGKHKEICPKLLQKRVDSVVIKRTKEHLQGKYCDYYIYPKTGDVLKLTSENALLEVALKMPTNHNFANGEYLVKDTRRHVIRVSYAGSQKKPSDLTYEIAIIVQ